MKHEPNVRTLLLDFKMMVSLLQLTFLSAAPIQISLTANPNELKTERLENSLHLCGENWLTNSRFSSLMEMTKVHSFSQRSMLVHKPLASKIAETELEKPVFKLAPLDSGQTFTLLHLICQFLVFRSRCCNGFSLKPTRSMCDGRLSASLPFCRLAFRGALFRGFTLRWVLNCVLSLTRSVALHDSTSCSRENYRDECGRPCDTLPCLFFSALWLQRSQSVLVQEIQLAKNIDMTCSKMCPVKTTTCLQVGDMS